jgi:hypothetical protein
MAPPTGTASAGLIEQHDGVGVLREARGEAIDELYGNALKHKDFLPFFRIRVPMRVPVDS